LLPDGDTPISAVMAIDHPFRRNCRQFTNGSYSEGGKWQYVLHPKFAKSPAQYVRAFLLIQKDLQELLDYVEPSEKNLPCHSYRIHEILLRSCIEVEANCKAILVENGYKKSSSHMTMNDYKKIDPSHRLSSYEISIPYWNGHGNVRKPFAEWSNGGALPWYQAYNNTKHDRHEKFAIATFERALDAICGLVAILSSQFITEDFGPSARLLAIESADDFESAIGGFFRVRFPDDYPECDRYSFDWGKLKDEDDPFRTIIFP
jgi:hypothetical protein